MLNTRFLEVTVNEVRCCMFLATSNQSKELHETLTATTSWFKVSVAQQIFWELHTAQQRTTKSF